jgi:pimeloyl-ACP methyl ester carboxylesterase
MRIARREVQVNGHLVRYKEAGAGDPVVLVHGLSGSTQWWARNVEPLARHFRVFVVDLPGFGAMCRSRLQLRLDEGAGWLLGWMETIGLTRASFIGHSMGGYICLRLAALRPDIVNRLVLTAPAVMARSRTLVGNILPLVYTTCAASPRFLATLTFDALRAGPLTLLRASKDIITREVRHEELSAVAAPTLLLWGEQDRLIPAVIGKTLLQRMPDAQLHIVKHGGHVPMFDQAREFNAAVLEFLRADLVEQ